MPGKVNPVMLEMTNMVCFQLIGYDTTIAYASQAGQLELNVMMPVIAHDLTRALGNSRSGAPRAAGEVHRRDHRERGCLPPLFRALHVARDRAQSLHRLPQGGGDREGIARDGQERSWSWFARRSS